MALRNIVLTASLAVSSIALAACETTPAPLAQIDGLQMIQLTPAEFDRVKLVVIDALAEPEGAYFHPNPAAGRYGTLIAVCGLLNGTNRDYFTTDAVYIATIDYERGGQAELLGLGGSGQRSDTELREFCRSELGLDI